MRSGLVVALILSTACTRSDPNDDAPRALADSTRLPPSAYAELAGSIRAALAARGCTIPQSYRDQAPHNAVRGRFTTSAVTDVAVLCAKDSSTTILVFHGESPDSVSEVAARHDSEFGEYDATTPWRFARAIDVASPEYIRSRHARYGGPQPPPLDHDGINDIFVGKASVVWYWNGSRWLSLQGAD